MTVKMKCKVCGIEFECNGDIECDVENSGNDCWCQNCSKKKKGFRGLDSSCYKGIKEKVKFT